MSVTKSRLLNDLLQSVYSAGCAAQQAQASGRDTMIGKLQDPMHPLLVSARRNTFEAWPYEGKEGWKCSAEKMAASGWCYTPQTYDPDGTTCYYCSLRVDSWEPDDDPVQEHKWRRPNCAFFALLAAKKQQRKLAVEKKQRRKRAPCALTWNSLKPKTLKVLIATLPSELRLQILYWIVCLGGVVEPTRPWEEVTGAERLRVKGEGFVPNPLPLFSATEFQETAMKEFGKANVVQVESRTNPDARNVARPKSEQEQLLYDDASHRRYARNLVLLLTPSPGIDTHTTDDRYAAILHQLPGLYPNIGSLVLRIAYDSMNPANEWARPEQRRRIVAKRRPHIMNLLLEMQRLKRSVRKSVLVQHSTSLYAPEPTNLMEIDGRGSEMKDVLDKMMEKSEVLLRL